MTKYVDNPYDFIGFKYGDKHSTEFKILRVSNGNRYQENLTPQFQATTTVVPGANQTYLFGTNYTQRTFALNIAYDDVSEQEMRAMIQWLRPDKPKPLIFDETPYKYYTAIISQPPQFNYICFTDKNNNDRRVYKGEANIQFVCYYPFAKSVSKYLSKIKDVITPQGKVIKPSDDELWGWYIPGLLLEGNNTDENEYLTFENSTSITIKNCSEMPSDYRLYIKDNWSGTVEFVVNDEVVSKFTIKPFTLKGEDTGIIYDSARQLCMGGFNGPQNTTPNLYNRYISNMLPKLPQGDVVIRFSSAPSKVILDYQFLYY